MQQRKRLLCARMVTTCVPVDNYKPFAPLLGNICNALRVGAEDRTINDHIILQRARLVLSLKGILDGNTQATHSGWLFQLTPAE